LLAVLLAVGGLALLRLWSAPARGPALLATLGPAGFVPDGEGYGTAVAWLNASSSGSRWRVLVEGFAAAGAPRASYDATRVLFAGRRSTGEPMQIWQVSASGSPPRSIVSRGESFDPAYLPDGRIVFARSLSPAGSDGPVALYTAAADGSEQHRITFGDARDRAPAVLPDGRIVFRRHPLHEPGRGRLFAIAPDGTGLSLFCEPTEGASIDRGPWVIDGRVLFAEKARAGLAGGFAGQRLVSVSALEPFGKRDLLVDAEEPANSDTKWFSSVGQLPDAGLIASAYAKGSGWIVRRLRSRTAPSDQPSTPAVTLNGFSAALRPISVAAAGPRPRPLWLTSVVDERKATGTLLCTDVYTSRLAAVAGLQRGSIRAVRVLTDKGVPIGEAPVETDGSFFVEVPSDRPLHLELLGSAGVIAKDSSGFWVRPNENRGCIGCHEDPELAPENRALLALDRGLTRMGTTVAVAPPGGH